MLYLNTDNPDLFSILESKIQSVSVNGLMWTKFSLLPCFVSVMSNICSETSCQQYVQYFHGASFIEKNAILSLNGGGVDIKSSMQKVRARQSLFTQHYWNIHCTWGIEVRIQANKKMIALCLIKKQTKKKTSNIITFLFLQGVS